MWMNTHPYIETSGGGRQKKKKKAAAAKHWISREWSKQQDGNVAEGGDEQRETAGKGAVELEIESINFKLM